MSIRRTQPEGAETRRRPPRRIAIALSFFLLALAGTHAYAAESVSPAGPDLGSDLQEQAVRTLQLHAEAGDMSAQASLGSWYLNGQYVEKDEQEALKWLTRAATSGHADAQFAVGEMWARGLGTQKSLEVASGWYERAALQGHGKAMAQLGHLYMTGRGAPQDDEKAFYWFRLAAEQEEDFNGQNALGFLYHEGRGTERNLELAAKWFQRSAEQGSHWAQANMGECYMKGEGVPKDLLEALKWYLIAERRDNPDSKRYIPQLREALSSDQIAEAKRRADAWLTEFPKRYATSAERRRVESLQTAAEQGNVAAMVHLGTMYGGGYGVPLDLAAARRWYLRAAETKDPTGMTTAGCFELEHGAKGERLLQAIRWLSEAADAGMEKACFHLGNLYAVGELVPQDHGKAFGWYLKGAQMGDPEACFEAGRALEDGRGTAGDPAKARDWHRRAADQWHGQAQLHLGRMFAAGVGGPKDLIEGYMWMSLAVDQDADGAQAAAREVAEAMSEADHRRAAQLKADWLGTHPLKYLDLSPSSGQ